MANITGAQNERVFQINKWLGLNQNPDGDTKLRMGEAALMRNWRGHKHQTAWPIGWLHCIVIQIVIFKI